MLCGQGQGGQRGEATRGGFHGLKEVDVAFAPRPLWLQFLCFFTRKRDRGTETKPGSTGPSREVLPLPARHAAIRGKAAPSSPLSPRAGDGGGLPGPVWGSPRPGAHLRSLFVRGVAEGRQVWAEARRRATWSVTRTQSSQVLTPGKALAQEASLGPLVIRTPRPPPPTHTH